MMRTSSLNDISTRQEKIAQQSRQAPSMVWTTLAHHIDVKWVHEAYRRTRKDAAVGVDGVTAEEYEAQLEENLMELLKQLKTGSYRAPAVRRVHLPKEGSHGKTRPIGITTLSDKVLQRAVLMVLEPIYEQDFLNCSYGFRPGRSAHQALAALWKELMDIKGGWVIDLDIQSFFDTVSWEHLRSFLDQRVRDGVIRRAIGKWLNAGVMEEGVLRYPGEGTPQGGVISSLLSNVYLHEVLDKWFAEVARPRLKGRAFLVRYADDAVLGFECEEDARRVMAILPQRFARYGLTLHPEKTRLLSFGRYAWDRAERLGKPKPEAFDFLGFTHVSAKVRTGFRLLRQTSRKKRQAKLAELRNELRVRRHAPLGETQVWLKSVLVGHYNYYGVPENRRGLRTFRAHVVHAWYRQLSRRGQRRRYLSTRAKQRIEKRFPLPKPRITHPWPEHRFCGP